MRFVVLLLVLAVLSACGSAAPAISAQGVLDRFAAAGLTTTNPHPSPDIKSSPVPQSFTEQLSFSIPALGEKGGQVFICDTKRNCDAIFAYFDALKGLAGPYLYQSPSGTVVVQLNSGLAPDEAAKYAEVVKALP